MVSESNKKVEKSKEKKGIYNPKNSVNDLTGSEWTFATKSVINKPFPVNMQHKLRSQHGGQKPPELCADLIKTFTKKGQTVLDPLAGVGGTLLGASLCQRKAKGIEINSKWKKIYEKVCKLENLPVQEMIVGDAKKELSKIKNESIDFILTDVPYWNMDKLAKTRSKNARSSKLSKFNKESDQSKEEWLEDMGLIFEKCLGPLKDKGYMAVFIGDIYREKQYHILSAELANKISELGFILKANLIWQDNSKSLHVYGYPHAFIPSMIHQNILIFRKEPS
ncbi:MAG: class I SAM-dependent methyltransferase [Candidatus Buchananbacteria bacterium]|nr:class I SAM-dependent methyltransferase [Candidatus Buchananbacteria bacterium]